MFTPPDPGPVNGHASSSADELDTHVPDGNLSESDLSDAQPAGARAASPASDDAAGSPDEGPAFAPEEEEEDESDPSDNDVVDDGDFDAPASPGSIQSNDASDHDASASGHAVAKRKAALAIEDVYMRENPELYGLRRSVR
jgi:chromodomain-helicase-DNA-binding protein 1